MKELQVTNFCISGIMSMCTAGSNWKDQQSCKFYMRASTSRRCMYFRETHGGHCDCVAAQKEIRSL
ncbi:MAG TPA: hypothetical protein ACFCUC_05320 [Desulfobacterales bacterium]